MAELNVCGEAERRVVSDDEGLASCGSLWQTWIARKSGLFARS